MPRPSSPNCMSFMSNVLYCNIFKLLVQKSPLVLCRKTTKKKRKVHYRPRCLAWPRSLFLLFLSCFKEATSCPFPGNRGGVEGAAAGGGVASNTDELQVDPRTLYLRVGGHQILTVDF